jgi:membrane associated rhomboid family serine protease
LKQLEILIYVLCASITLRGGITPELKAQAAIIWDLVILTWSVDFINFVFCGGTLNRFGLRPGSMLGLLGILFSPFLHGDWTHLIDNTFPFMILGWFVMFRGPNDFYIVTVFVALFSGFCVWLIGNTKSIHIGASSVIFGYFGFLLVDSYFQRDALSIVLTAIVGFIYGNAIWGIFPRHPRISWEGHLSGFLGGMLAASYIDVLRVIFSKIAAFRG